MNFAGSPFAESAFAGTGLLAPVTSPPPVIGGEPEVPLVIDPFTIEVNGMSMKGYQLADSLTIDMELGRQGTAQFSLINIGFVPDVGMTVRILFYSDVLFVGAIDRLKITSNNLQTFVQYDFECTDNSYLLFRQKIKKTFVNQTPASIAQSFVNNELLYDGVTLGLVDVTVPIPVADADGVSIFEFLNEIATSVGLVFSIDNDKRLNFRGANLQVASVPLTADNIERCTIELDRETYRNKQTTTVTGTPATTAEQPLIISLTRANEEQRLERLAIEGTYGIYSERTEIVHPSSNETVQLTRLANAYNKILLGVAGSIRRSLSIRTREYGYKVGQLVAVTLDHLGISGNWVIQRLSMREESGRFLVYSMNLNQTSLLKRAQELWLDVVNKGTIAILPPTAVFTHTLYYEVPGTQTFTNNTAADLEVQVSCYGAGGGGGGGAKSEWPGYGGIATANGAAGGGGCLAITIFTMHPGEVLTLVVGSGGSGGAAQYRFESLTNAVGSNGTNGGNTSASRPGNFTICLAYGGEGGWGAMANARFNQRQSWPAGRGGTGLFGNVITVGGAANGGAGGSGVTPAAGSAGGHGKILVEW